MDWTGAPHLVGLSGVVGRRDDCFVYALEDRQPDRVKIGMTTENPERYCASKRTMNPDLRLVFSFRTNKKTEREIHDLFDSFRCVQRKNEPGHEWFFKSPEVSVWMAACLSIHGGSDVAVEYESARDWLKRVSLRGTATARAAALSDLAVDDRLAHVRRRFRGGFVLWEAIGGRASISTLGEHGQGVAPFARNEPARGRFRYDGALYAFHIYKEACSRYGDKPPIGAIRAGLFPLNHFVRTERTLPDRAPDPRLPAADDQLELFGGSSR